MENAFFDHWSVLLRTATIGVSAYACLIALLRLSGKRTLAKMNAFDLVVTVSLGSMLASLLVNKEVALAQGALAFAVLIGLQYAVSWSSTRARWVRRVVTGEPSLLLHRGMFLPDTLRRARVTEAEVRAAIRSAGCASMEDAHAVVLETDGSFSVVRERRARDLQPRRCAHHLGAGRRGRRTIARPPTSVAATMSCPG